jgi:Uma2 family endonuclease
MNASLALNFKALEPKPRYIPLKPKITEAEYWEKYYHYPEVTYELKNGALEEKGVSDFLTFLMSDWFSELLGYYLKTHSIAKKTGLEMGFGLPLSSHKKDIRRPDLGIVLNSNPIPLKPTDKSYKGTYDLCIEAISDSSTKEIERDTINKKQEYAQTGVKEYYILDGHNRYTAFYRLGKRGLYVPIKPVKGDIIQSTVLPGFQFRLNDLDTQPLPDEMIDDPVYQDFVLPGYQETKEKFQAEKKARQEAERQIQQAKQRAEQLAQKLRALGIDPDSI